MEARSLDFILDGCAGTLARGTPEVRIERICTDSRRVQRGDLFVALQGDRFDGHDFLAEVAGKKVAALLVQKDRGRPFPSGPAVITVEDPRRALGRLAARYRGEFGLPVIAVAGSNGKTTTKELLASVFRQEGQPLWSEASYNNDIGVPLTLLNLARHHTVAILEAGTNHPGELRPLLRLIQPKYGVITSIGREHLEFFGDLPGVVEEEGCLAEALPPDGCLFVHGDVPEMETIVKRSRAPVVRVGWQPSNDWQATARFVGDQGTEFHLDQPRGAWSGDYRLQLLGRHQVINALLALAVGAELGLSPAVVRRGLADCLPLKMRLQLWEARGVRVLDDAYNANADSMLAALQTLRDLSCPGRRVAILGDMAELGIHGAAAHREVGRRTAELGIDALITIGPMAQFMGHEARAAGLGRIYEFSTTDEAIPQVGNLVRPGDLVLLKASRSAGLERVAAAIRQ